MSTPTITVETRTEQTRRVLSIQGAAESPWELSVWQDCPDGEPRISAMEAARRLGYTQPRNATQIVERIFPENKRPHVRITVMRTSMPKGGTREVKVRDYQLTEAELLKFIARSETPVAEAVLDEMIAVYMAVRRHLVAAVPVKAHERKLPAPKAPVGFIDRDAPPPLPPLSQRLGSATRIRDGKQYWDLVVEVSAAEVAALSELSRGTWKAENVAGHALSAWIHNACAMGVLRLHAGR